MALGGIRSTSKRSVVQSHYAPHRKPQVDSGFEASRMMPTVVSRAPECHENATKRDERGIPGVRRHWNEYLLERQESVDPRREV
jgi:hypothetical protein